MSDCLALGESNLTMLLLLDHPVLLFFVVFAGLIIMVEIGLRLGIRTGVNLDEERHEQLVGTRNGLVGLLSLLLGFTLAMSPPRFDQRRQLIVAEANAIGTAGLRAEMLSEPYHTKIKNLLLQYMDSRIGFFEATRNREELQTLMDRSKRLQNDLWREAVAAAQQNPNPITSIFVQSLNEVIDLSEKRLATAVENRIPVTIWVMLIGIAVLSCLTLGYSMRRRFFVPMIIIPLAISIVISIIADLDTPRSGFIYVPEQSLHRLKQELQGSPSKR